MIRVVAVLIVVASPVLVRADDAPDPSNGGEIIEIVDQAPDQVRASSYSLTGDDIRRLAGANNDTLRAAEAMPGVARTPMGFGGLVLRGASPRDSSVYIDGIEVPIAFHFGGVTSFFPSTMLSDVTLMPGGFDVAYGRVQGGLVTMTSRPPRTDRWRAGGEVSAIQSAAVAEGPLPAGGGVMIGVRRSYLDAVAAPFVASDTPLPSSWDAELRASWGDPRRAGRLSPIVFASGDRIASQRLDLNVDAAFVRAALPYLRQWGASTLHVVPWLGWTDVSFSYGGSVFEQEGIPAQTLARPTFPGGLRADVTRDATWGDVAAGVELDGTDEREQRRVGGAPSLGPPVAWLDLAAWTEARVVIDRLSLRPGLRLERYGLTGETVVDPRLTVHDRLTSAVTLQAAVGRYHQPPTVSDIDPAGGNPQLRSSYADQLSLGVACELPAGIAASLTGYYTYGRSIGVPVGNPNGLALQPDFGGFGPTFQELLEKELGTATYRANTGRSRDYGVELALRRSVGRWFGMLSYTLARAQRTDDPSLVMGWRPYDLDQRHDLNAAGSMRLASWLLGARITAVSGDPYSPITADATGQLVVHPWAATLPTYFQVDLRVDRRWRRRWGELDAYIDIQNATDRRNLEGRPFDAPTNR